MHGRPSYAEMVRRGNMIHLHAGNDSEAELSWLSCCLLGEVKSPDLLNDLGSLLMGAGFLNTMVKYVGGLRVLIECVSVEAAQKCLNDGLSTLLSWFSWVCPWSLEKEVERPGRLIWLSISGVPLHVWNCSTFTTIASTFGKVLEVENWTGDRTQTHIGRVLILSHSVSTISEAVALTVKNHVFNVRVAEDVAEIVDFGLRYDLDVANSIISDEEGSGCGGNHFAGSSADSEVEATPPSLLRKSNRPCQLSLHQLKIVESLNHANSTERGVGRG